MSAAREVIQDWADGEGGFTFERGRMEKAVRDVCLDNPVKLHSATQSTPKPTLKLNKEDVDFIVRFLKMGMRLWLINIAYSHSFL